MLAQVEVGARVDAFHLFESEREVEFYVGCGVCVMGQFFVVVEAVVLVTEPECAMPVHAELLPVVEPFHFVARAHEELHFHLFEFPHAEYELTGHYLVAESLTDLRDAERQFHSSGFLNIQEIDENALCGFGT